MPEQKVVRGEIWEVDFEPQPHKEEPGKRNRPALVIQTEALNAVGHATTIIIPGTSQTDGLAPADKFPLRVRVQKTAGLTYDTDLLIDQIRSVSNRRLTKKLCSVGLNHLKRVEEALRILVGR